MTPNPLPKRGGARKRCRRAHVPLAIAAIMLVLAVACTEAVAQGNEPRRGWVERDTQGRRLGTTDPRSGGGYVLRDTQGRRTGTVEPGPGGTWVKRDAQGRRTGTSEPR